MKWAPSDRAVFSSCEAKKESLGVAGLSGELYLMYFMLGALLAVVVLGATQKSRNVQVFPVEGTNGEVDWLFGLRLLWL